MGLLCGPLFGRRRRPETTAPGDEGEPAPRRGRETLRKKTPTPPAAPSRETSSTAAKKDRPPSAIELDNAAPVRASLDEHRGPPPAPQLEVTVDPPPDCVELSADPPLKPLPVQEYERQRPERPSVEIEESRESPDLDQALVAVPARSKHRRQSLPAYPLSLVPGSPPVTVVEKIKTGPRRGSTWSEDLHSGTTYAFLPRSYGFGSGWQSRPDLVEEAMAVWQTVSASPSSSPSAPSTVRTASDSSLTTASSLSSESLASPKEAVDIVYPLSPQRQKFSSGVPARTMSSQPSMSSLSPRQSAANLSQLLARHAMLESRRQILMQLHEVEQEQEYILDELAATVPEGQASAPMVHE